MIVTVFQDGYRRALRALRDPGSADRSPYHNVLIMKVDDPLALLAAVEARTEESPVLYDAFSRVAPALRTFDFHSAEDLMDNARSILREWSSTLADRAFHVRLHRRGTRHNLGTQEAERLLNDAALDATGGLAVPGKIAFTDADTVIAIDTINDRAGLGLWTREDLARHACCGRIDARRGGKHKNYRAAMRSGLISVNHPRPGDLIVFTCRKGSIRLFDRPRRLNRICANAI